ncbi:glutaminase liver isoform, mitochondrial isoform X2 [Dendropsophus ebraccatus]|uniref:glutaminase liver isoform, mitochondrial isoform X2 n=1 Tax=Dendropsophus ebraccatus TaxID=150705 RepID=UPI00383178D3
MFFLRWRLWSDPRVLPWMVTSSAAKKHVPRRHFGEQRPGTFDGTLQPHKEIITCNTVLQRLTNLLFYTISEGQERLPVNKFINTLKLNGLLSTDPRLKDCMDMLRYTVQESMMGASMDLEIFQKCVQSNIVLLTQVVCKKCVIPDFEQFTLNINQLYDGARRIKEGEVANYIPQLAKVSPDRWGVSLCTVDGQRYSVGDTEDPLCLQSCVKPLKYAIAVNDLGSGYVHQYVGKEPSGLRFNKLSLNHQGRPHNPMVNAGAIVSCSLIKQGANKAEKFDYIMQFLKRMAGNEFIGFSNATFQSEKETGDRNYAIGYYLKEKKCFPEGADMVSALDLYFQVGLPAKSGVSGAILLVVPNIMGVFCWSPSLDRIGNSVRGIHFCHELVNLFNFHHFDNLRHCAKKVDPRKETRESQHKTVVNLLFAAYSGDVSALRRFALSAMDMEQKDYDSRTALHVGAAEGHMDVVKFLTEGCKVNPFVEDRWGSIPLQDAIRFERHDVVKLLTEYQETYVKKQMGAEEPISLENLESMV